MALSVELHKKFKGFQMDVAFEHDGGSLGILGGSGMGKSMTLKMIAGLVTVSYTHLDVYKRQVDCSGIYIWNVHLYEVQQAGL